MAIPDNLFVAGFIGSPKMNMLDARVESVEADTAVVAAPGLGAATLRVRLRSRSPAPGDAVTLGTRPEHITVGSDGAFSGRVRAVEQLGSVSLRLSADGRRRRADS